MIHTLSGCIREYKKPTLLTPVCMVGEVVCECTIPLLTAELINSIQAGCGMNTIAQYGVKLFVIAMLSLLCGAASGWFAAEAAAGVWKGLKDLYAIGFIDKLPRLISAQSTGCYPLNRAIQENKPWEPMEENTIADSTSVVVPRNADKALMAIRESNGIAVNVTDEEILAAQKLLGRTCGVFGEPAGVTGTAAVKKACEEGLIEKGATVVSVVTGNGLKDVANAIKSAGEPINIKPDLDLMVEEFAKRGVTVE